MFQPSRRASERALGPTAPPMEPNVSLSPVDLPTPPDDEALAAPPAKLRDASWPSATAPPRKMPLLPAYRAELPGRLPPTQMGLRSYGVGLSSFQLSAERQNASSDTVEDTDMSVDDVFSNTGYTGDRRDKAAPLSDMEDQLTLSPALVPLRGSDESVPTLEPSTARSYPDVLGRSPGSLRRPWLRTVDSASGSLAAGPSSRRTPYNVPSRSPGSMPSQLGPSFAMSMTPSTSYGMRAPRMGPWASYRRSAAHAGAMRPSTSAPLTTPVLYQMYDDEETDDEVSGAVDEEATDDESDVIGMRGYRHGIPVQRAPARTSPMAPLARSLPSQAPFHMGRSPEDASRAQVHMAAAALDRLSMTGYSVPPVPRGSGTLLDDDKRLISRGAPAHESDEVAAIRDRLGGAANCSAFISKLWHLMINPELYGKYIHWSEAGDAIILNSEPDVAAEFAAEVLPKLFKHGNNASFVRQLNLYGFQRVSSSRLLDPAELQAVNAQAGTSRFGPSSSSYNTATELYGAHSSFAHPRFRRGQESWLASMKPRSSKKSKKPAPASTDEAK